MKSDLRRSIQFLSIVCTSALLLALLSGCLQTREEEKEAEERQVVKKELTNMQQTSADSGSRLQDVEDEVRKNNGRLEVLEAKFQQQNSRLDKSHQASEAKAKDIDQAYREEFTKLGTQISQLADKVTAQQTQIDEIKKALQAKAEAQASDKKPFGAGEDLFAKKKWKEAILSFERYRSQSPNGRNFCVATYKIGVAFQEMGSNDDAKSFYDEVVAKCGNSDEAKKSETRLKKLKK